MLINLQNVEEMLLFDKKVHQLLPMFKHLFDSWIISQKVPVMKNLGKRSIIELLNSIQQEHITILEEYFGDSITLDKLDQHLVKNINTSIDITDLETCKDYLEFAIYRKGEQLYISAWR